MTPEIKVTGLDSVVAVTVVLALVEGWMVVVELSLVHGWIVVVELLELSVLVDVEMLELEEPVDVVLLDMELLEVEVLDGLPLVVPVLVLFFEVVVDTVV